MIISMLQFNEFNSLTAVLYSTVLGHIAIPYYEKVLQMEPIGNTESERKVSFNLLLQPIVDNRQVGLNALCFI